ncbi:sulfatase [Rhizobium sp. R72]|uniref:phosphoethanolamine transferase n=1 Tax=unclassified Rhizobium TaxID=2613769 RepID=UPI000B532ED5|nr:MULTISPECIES: phosphoethanolamine--lipid A transferase [unclassified Rhizobium]OWV86919.1 sulfatase [Rhizobium sp. R693]OWV95625.1 sulfatase [Rhizobium sp. R72]OWV95925.1 sulfatase [Rhizobium sp. R711]
MDDFDETPQHRRLRPCLGSVTLSVLVAVYILAVANETFWIRAYTHLAVYPVAFIAFVIGIVAVTIAAMTAFSVKYLIKPALIFFVLVSVMAAWFTDQYGIVIDKEMIRNAAIMTQEAAAHLITPAFLLHLFFTGMLPSLFILWVRVVHRPFPQKFAWNMAVILPCLAVFVAAGLGFSQTYAAVGRLHRDIILSFNPFIPIGNAARYLFASERDSSIARRPLGLDAHQRSSNPNHKPRVIVLVVGESARAQNFSLGEYSRETNPELKARDVVYYANSTSCGTTTGVSLPCMFSAYPKRQYTLRKGLETDNLTDILGHAKVKVEWWDNNTGSYTVANRIPYRFLPDAADPRFCRDGECLDTALLDRLDEWLSGVKGDSVLVLHQNGSHGPGYYQRYPDDFRRFIPDCRTAEFGACTREEIINAYDNTVLFTDHVLARVIDILKRHGNSESTAMLYVSDHGESLGENGLYLHGAPDLLAPPQQTHVPIIAWLAPDFSAAAKIDTDCLARRAAEPTSHDNFFHSVLGLMDVATSLYDAKLDLFAACRDAAAG